MLSSRTDLGGAGGAEPPPPIAGASKEMIGKMGVKKRRGKRKIESWGRRN